MPGTVKLVSATLVASTILRPVWGLKMRFCSLTVNREYKGKICVCAKLALIKAAAVSRISRSPFKKIRMSPWLSVDSSSTAAKIPPIISVPSVDVSAAICSAPLPAPLSTPLRGRYNSSTG